MKQRHGRLLLGMVALGVLATPLLAAGAAVTDAEIAKLEALAQQQAEQIEALEQQVAAAAQQDVNRARTEMMKSQIRQVLSEEEFRESMMPSTLQAGYDDGFFIRSVDDKFKMTFFGRMQFRWTYYQSQPENDYLLPGFRRSDRSGFDLNRARFGVFGHAYSPDWTYYIEMEADEADAYDWIISELWVDYRFVDELHFAAGLLKFASTRAQMTSDANLQFVDRPIVDAVFGLGYGIGARLWGQLFDGKVDYYLDVANQVSNGEGVGIGRTITTDEALYTNGHDNNPVILFRTVWHALGDESHDMGTQADHNISDTPGMDVGFHYVFNEDWHDGTSRMPFVRRAFFGDGGFGLTDTQGTQWHQFGLESAFKYMGFSATGEYIVRIVDMRSTGSPPFTPFFQLTGDESTTVQHGGYVQCGYFLPIPGQEKKWEVVGRIGGILSNIGGTEGVWTYAGGLNYYIVQDKIKLQTDVTKVSEAPISSSRYSLANVNDDALIWRMQLQVSF